MLSSTRSYRPACVILDFEMPGINGLELLRHLARTGVPVIFTTANDAPAVRETAIASGAAGYLQSHLTGQC
ncbi:response regulator [Paraburkholderia graminis]